MQLARPNNILGEWIKTEDEYQVALTYAEKRIGEFTREDMASLVEVMTQWRVLLGATAEVTEAELIIICQFVYDNFKRFTLSDIKLAMNWAISGRLEIGYVSQKIISSFYVSKCLNAYEAEKRTIYNQLMYRKERVEQQNQLQQAKEFTPEEKADNFKKIILEYYNAYQNNRFFIDFGEIVYKWLKKTNQLNATNELVVEAVNYGKKRYLDEQNDSKTAAIGNAIEKQQSREYREKKLARHYLIMKFFERSTIQSILQVIKPEQFIENQPKP